MGDQAQIMQDDMLLRKIEVLTYFCDWKDITVGKKGLKGPEMSSQRVLILYSATCKVTKVCYGREHVDHLLGDMVNDDGKVDLHEHLHVIAGPLFETSSLQKTSNAREQWSACSSMINVIENGLCTSRWVGMLKIKPNPSNKMVFVDPLDNLVQDARGNELVNVGVGRVIHERL